MTRRAWYYVVGVFALAVPAVLAITVFPTAMVDLSENYAGGRFFPLTTPEHPPMQLWVSGVLALIFPPSALAAIIANQVLNALTIGYVYAILRPLIGDSRAALTGLLLATCLYIVVGPESYAVGADTLQLPVWTAIVYHLVRAGQTNRWRHWIGLGVWAALGIYTKYAIAILFVALTIASLFVPEYRRQWRNPRFYLAIILGLILVSPHLLALRENSESIANAEIRLQPVEGILLRLKNLGYVAVSPLFYLIPGWIIVALGLVAGDFRRDRAPPIQPPLRLIQVTCLAGLAILVAMVLFLGLTYVPRYDAPFFPLIALAVAPLFTIDEARWPSAEPRVLWSTGLVAAAILVVGTIAYTVFTSHAYMQEPIAAAEAIMHDDWHKHYACGPGYVLGDRTSAHGMSMVGERTVGIPVTDVHLVSWFDPKILAAQGAIVAYRGPIPTDELAAFLPGLKLSDEKSFTLPLLRTLTKANLTYHYAFVAPAGCPPAPAQN